MKIKEIHLAKIPKTTSLGIEPKHLKRLGQVIALVGKNGSGKSRILELIKEYILNEISLEDVASNKVEMKALQDKFNSYSHVIKSYIINREKKNALDKSPQEYKQSDEYKMAIKEANSEYIKLIQQIPQNQRNAVDSLPSQLNQSLKNLSQNNLRIIDSEKLRSIKESFDNNSKGGFEDIIENVPSSQTFNEFNMISDSALLYLQKLPHKLAADYHDCFGDETKLKRRKSYRRYSLIKSLVKKFLGKEFIWENQKTRITEETEGASIHVKGIWKIEKREFNYNEFSNGEKILFSYCMLFFLLEQNKNSQ